MINNITKGIQAYFQAFGLISKLKLWKYFAIPMVISFVTALIIGISAYSLSDNLGAFIAKIWPWDWGSETFTSISSFVGGIVVLAIGLILFKHIIMALSAPFMSPVSQKIENYLLGDNSHNHRKSNFSEQLSRGIRMNVRNLGRELLLTIPLLLLKFIPGINMISIVLLFLLQAYYAGFGNMDYTLERHFNFNESVRFVKRRRGLAIGNGIVFILFLFIPIVGVILVLPLSVTASSLVTIKEIEKGKLIS